MKFQTLENVQPENDGAKEIPGPLTAKFIRKEKKKLIYGHKSQSDLLLHRIVKDINDLI
jgi:hypothetical protein